MVGNKIIYHGRVQGVGFRYTVLHLAKDLKVNGYVKNLPDGTVELAAEGEEGEVEELLSRIDSQMARNIREKEVFTQTLRGYLGFEIRY